MAGAQRSRGAGREASGVGSPLDWARQLEVPAARLGRLLVIEDALSLAAPDTIVTNS